MSTLAITPYLFFGGTCEEAIALYKEALGAKVQMLMRFNESPDQPPEGCLPPGFDNKVMHASIEIDGQLLMVSDGIDEKGGFSGVSISLTVSDEADCRRKFEALAAGGTVTMPIGKTFFSPCFGGLRDKFGVAWMLIVPSELPGCG